MRDTQVARRNKGRGFTFIEVLLVVTIFSILSLAIYSTFASGLRLWDRIQGEALTQRKALLSMEKLSADLRQSPDFSKIGFQGTDKEITFPVLSGNDIHKVIYILENNTLLQKLENFKDIVEKREETKTRILLPDIEDLKFSFAFQEQGKLEYTWKDDWNKEEGIPKIVKIELKTKDVDLVKQIILPVS